MTKPTQQIMNKAGKPMRSPERADLACMNRSRLLRIVERLGRAQVSIASLIAEISTDRPVANWDALAADIDAVARDVRVMGHMQASMLGAPK